MDVLQKTPKQLPKMTVVWVFSFFFKTNLQSKFTGFYFTSFYPKIRIQENDFR